MLINKIKEIIISDSFKKILILGLLLIGVILISIPIINKINSDGMTQTKGVKIYYRTYTKEKGWSKWSKNGKTSGNKKYDITNIEIKVKSRTEGTITYSIYQKGKWNDNSSQLKNKNINGIKISLGGKLRRKYNVYYRTYNDKDKWLDWTGTAGISGNAKKTIKAIEIKIIPSGAYQRSYLKDYNNTLNGQSLNF